MGYKKVKTDPSKNYLNASEALSDEGYHPIGKIVYKSLCDHKTSTVFKKDGVEYYLVSMDHFNTTVYSVTIRRIDELTDYELMEFEMNTGE